VTVYHIAADLNLVGALSAMLEEDRVEEERMRKGETHDDTETVGQKCLKMKNDIGETPLDLAVKEGHVGCVMLLNNEADEEAARTYIQEEQTKLKGKTQDQSKPKKENEPVQSIKFKSKIDAIGAFEEEVEKSAEELLKITGTDNQQVNEQALQLKKEGNAHFVKREYTDAIKFYTDAIRKNPRDATFYSNRSACCMAVKDYDQALSDAIMTRLVRADWTKGFYRVAIARLALERFDDAAEAAWGGLKLDNENGELKSLLQKCVKKGRKDYHEKSTKNSSEENR